jgi:hypothetical protein
MVNIPAETRRRMLSARSVPRTCKNDSWGEQLSYVQESVKRGLRAREAEESPPFEAVSGERLEKRLSGCCGDL